MRRFGYAYRGFFRALIYLLDDRYFLFYCFSWFFIRLTRISGHPIWVLNNWLTDFVFVPLVIHVAQSVGIYVLGRSMPYRYPLYQILLISLITSYIFEYLMPVMTDYNTADGWDVAMYFAGGIFYCYLHQPYSLKKYAK